MPISKENQKRYPKDWPAISRAIRERADNACEQCGLPNGALGARRKSDGAFLPVMSPDAKPGDLAWCGSDDHGKARLTVVQVVLTVAHLDHTPENCDPSNLRAWCQRCHLVYDREHHAANAAATRRARLKTLELFEVGDARLIAKVPQPLGDCEQPLG
jgi:5-methylcytosine-specific restriction endonuclease McrA